MWLFFLTEHLAHFTENIAILTKITDMGFGPCQLALHNMQKTDFPKSQSEGDLFFFFECVLAGYVYMQ